MNAKLKLITAMLLFGSIGLFVRFIPLESMMIAFFRALIGAVFLFGVLLLKKTPPSIEQAKKQKMSLFLSGLLLGLNWVFLFEAYKKTSLSQATLLYYTAPVLVLFYSVVVLKERLSWLKGGTMLLALTGMGLTLWQPGIPLFQLNIEGILFGISAAVCYAGVMILNPRLKGFKKEELAFFQLTTAALVLLPYNLPAIGSSFSSLTPIAVLLLVVVGIVHTGIAYQLYFSALTEMNPSTAALMSYIDPLSALLFSAVLLKENLLIGEQIGGGLMLLAAVLQELPPSLAKKEKNRSSKKKFFL